jgi:hypothetical protein
VWLEIAGAEDRLVKVVVALETLLLGGAIGVGRGLIEPMSGGRVGAVVVADVGEDVGTAGALEVLTTAELAPVETAA